MATRPSQSPTTARIAAGAASWTRGGRAPLPWAGGLVTCRREALLDVEDFRGAIRIGEWKLIVHATLPGQTELYNLRADPSEEDNQAERNPDRVRTMLKRLYDYAWDMA